MIRQNRKSSKRSEEKARLTLEIKRIFDEEKFRAGSIRITKRLKSEGRVSGKNHVAKIMYENKWRAKAARKFKATTNSNHLLPVAPNLLEQNFTASRANQKWVSDITYIWTDEGWLYLATVMDLYSRKLISWSLSERMTSKLVIDVLQAALWSRSTPKNVI